MSSPMPTIVGPLTAFSAPEHCSTPYLGCDGSCSIAPLISSATCSDGTARYDANCFPGGESLRDVIDTSSGVFYTGTSCPVSQIAVDTTIAFESTQINCCPIDYSATSAAALCTKSLLESHSTSAYYCVGQSAHSVDLVFSPMNNQSLVGGLGGNNVNAATVLHTIAMGPHSVVVTGTIEGLMILPQIRYFQVEALQTGLFTTAQPRTSFQSVSPTNPVAAGTADRTETTSFSSGSKIAMGVSIPVVFIISGFLLFLLTRQRQRRLEARHARHSVHMRKRYPKAELVGNEGLVSGDTQYEKAELHANKEHQPGELDAVDTNVDKFIYELPANRAH
ncbi:hypothetical protein BDV96DRAFT_607454 [Lophiotrema nucula]|uniref:Uncharacterized protein n=1 Tax=Lophiotrema nucula TaxID=690887 RepID=A0A6A5YJS8_9PLEO|nr:hypothetical protein BDV96DRAFT_607454 [Lophiotrema nucula]